MNHIEIDDLTFGYGADILIRNLILQLHPGWTGVVGSNGCGKSTLLALISGYLTPESGRVLAPPALLLPQSTAAVPSGFEEFCFDYGGEAGRLKSLLGIDESFPFRWATLSHGERRRAQIGEALYRRPEALLLDEPTNHLDQEARDRIAAALEEYEGVGVLVSHDRILLERLCGSILFFDAQGVALHRTGYSEAVDERRKQRLAAKREREKAVRELGGLRRTAGALRSNASAADRRRSGRALEAGDADGRFRRNLARLTGKDATQGRLLRSMQGRIRQAEERLESIGSVAEREVRFWFHDIATSAAMQRDSLCRIPAGTVSAGTLRLDYPELVVRPGERIIIMGPNGSGKSTLMRELVARLAPDEIAWLPQELDGDQLAALRRRLELLDNEERARVYAVISELGTDPVRMAASSTFSAGEERKLWLALESLRNPALLALDEPGNHLDLPALETLEEALADYPGALVVVTHDSRLAERTGGAVWRIRAGADCSRLSIEGPPG